jgi:two-component system, OmpR family, copper resistance phosphate regulon response regulator CusR
MRILLVEDDAGMARSIASFLRNASYAVDIAESGAVAFELAERATYDAVVLDLRLPDVDGLEVCRRLRASANPPRILMATARDALDDRIRGLDEGADDYLVKPYALPELVARLRAVLRRPSATLGTRLTVAELVLNLSTRRGARGERPIELTTKEFAVLEVLMRHAGEVLTREHISEHAWDENYDPASNVIDVYIGRLRRKIDAEGETPMLHTIRGAGYRLGEADSRARRGGPVA